MKRKIYFLFFVLFSFWLTASANAAPANDNFAGAQVIGNNPGLITSNNFLATKETGEPTHAGNAGGHSVWYKWTYPANFSYVAGYTYTVRQNDTDFDTLLAVYTGTSLNNLTLVASNDDYGSTPSNRTSTVYFEAVPGTTYYIAVDGYSGASGNFKFTGDINRTHGRSNQYKTGTSSAISVFRPWTGNWHIQSSGGLQSVQFGLANDIPVPADFDGDTITDFAIFRPSNGAWYVLNSRTNTLQGINFGTNGDKPVPGDYTGNGYADFCVFRPSNGTWYVMESQTNQFSARQFGQAGDKPAVRDYDSDGKLDFTVFRPSNGTWYILKSRDNSFQAQQFGTSEDIPVPSGYTATGRADIGVWRPSTGTWYWLNSASEAVHSRQFGQAGDIPQPIDYAGGGNTDYGVYRPSNGTWYIQEANGNFYAIPFGANGDIPTTTAYPIQQ